MRDLLKIVGLVLALATSAGAGQPADTRASLRDAALAADARFDSRAALAALDRGLTKFPGDPGLLAAKGRIYWRLLRTKSAEEALIAAARSRDFAAEANYWLARIYDFKGSHAENAFPGFHEEVSYRPRASAAYTAAGTPNPEWPASIAAGEAAIKNADALVARLQADPAASNADVVKAIEARINVRPDPQAYIAGANALLARRDAWPIVARMAVEGRAAGERFISENESSYKLDGKVQASRDRNQAVFADIAGWALFLQGDVAAAEPRLAEAARLYRNADATNQMHLAELSRRKQDAAAAAEHFLTALSLAGASPAQREQAKAGLRELDRDAGEDPADFEKRLAARLDRKRDDRRKALLGNMQGRRVPALVLTDLQGRTVDLRAERGNVVLLNFFSAW